MWKLYQFNLNYCISCNLYSYEKNYIMILISTHMAVKKWTKNGLRIVWTN